MASSGGLLGAHMASKLVITGSFLNDFDADFDPEASVRSALTRAALATRGCKFYDVVCFPSDAAATEGKGGLHLDDEDLDTLTLLQLRDSLGLNLVVHEHTPVKVPETEWIELCVAEAVVAEALLIGEQQAAVEAAARHAAEAHAQPIGITLLTMELASVEGEAARTAARLAETKAEANAASLISKEAAAASRKELHAVQLAAEKRNRALATAKSELEAAARARCAAEAELAAPKAELCASDEARRVDREQHALQMQEHDAAWRAVSEAEEERADAAEQRAAKAEADMASEATRADAAEKRAIAIEALLASELRSLDTDELSVCHDAMEGFWEMHDKEKSLVSRISSVC